jgi:hypothetical protein
MWASISAAKGLHCSRNRGKFRGVRPEHGGRLELRLTHASLTKASYALSIFSPNAEAIRLVQIESATGSLDFEDWQGTPPPAWLDALARALLRTVLRQKQSEGEWPRRLTRWRPEPRV